MKLVIVESPTKAKTLTGILGKDYKIDASMGHIRDLPKSGLGIDVENSFNPIYIIPEKAEKTLNQLRSDAQKADMIILATDPDREGEAISWHIKEILDGNVIMEDQIKKKKPTKKSESPKKSGKSKRKKESKDLDISKIEKLPKINVPYKRVVFHELTKSAVLDAFNHPGDLDMHLVDAQQARRVLDRLVGYKLSPLLWKKVRYGLSAGRVQSVAVRLVVERERERKAFNPEEYWTIEGLFTPEDAKRNLKAELANYQGKKLKISSGSKAEEVQKELKNDSFLIHSVKKSERKKNPYPPFKTSTLQQSMSNVFGYTAKRTMQAAQKLFEKGLITYHRTDSFALSPQFINGARDFVDKHFGKEYTPEKPNFYKNNSKNAQEAHEAVRPTNINSTPDKLAKLTAEEHKVYTMIWKRALESQMNSAVYDQTQINVLSKKGYEFRANGSVIKFAGWLKVGDYLNVKEENDEIVPLPDFTEGEPMTLVELKPEQHFTQPPARYSDATLIKKLEELGIGRPSTYAPTIATIQARGYVDKEGRYFVPKDVAYVVTDLLVDHFKDVIDYQFTAGLEEKLDNIAAGEVKWVPVIEEFYFPFEKELIEKDKLLQKTDVTNLGESGENCPDCGRPLVFKLGKYGKFLSCSGYPDCTYAKPVIETILPDGSDAQDGGVVKEDYGKCENCEDGVMVLRMGKFGKFLACSNYPKCKTAKPFLQKIGVTCPKCKQGDVIVKKARGRVFYGCSKYPECDFASWKKPVEGEEYVEKPKRTKKSSRKKTKTKAGAVAKADSGTNDNQ